MRRLVRARLVRSVPSVAASRARSWRLALVALSVLVASVVMALAVPASRDAIEGLVTPNGTASLQAATCADWRSWSAPRRAGAVRTLALAATGGDPENQGATLASGAAYTLLDRDCSTRAARPAVLYELYNRAASFAAAGGAAGASLGGFGSSARR